MAVTPLTYSTLPPSDHQMVQDWVEEFSRSWDEKRFMSRAGELPPPPNPVRPILLLEMIKIDIDRQWQQGRHARLEVYLKAFPELGTMQTVSTDLIVAEYQARQRQGAPVELAKFLARFPNRSEEVRRLVEQTGPPPVVSPGLQETRPISPSTHPKAMPSGERSLPEQFGRYRIIKRLGQGGMGSVYLAYDSQLDRKVALKVPHFQPDDGPEVHERFYREAKAAATLQHPNVCPVYDVGQIEGVHYLTMAFIEGKPLSELITRDKPLPQRNVAALVRKLALALQQAHASGVIHRDLKPANIMINTRKEPVIMDFGLARRVDKGDIRLTKTGAIMGTPAYMAPEQVCGDVRAMGPATDICSLGVILYELLTGRLPFEGNMNEVLGKILMDEPVPPSVYRTDLEPALEAICLKSMAKKLEHRYRSMGEVAAALGEYLKLEPGNAKPAAAGGGKIAAAAASPPGPTATLRPRSTMPAKARVKKTQDADLDGSSDRREPPRRFHWGPLFVAAILLAGVAVFVAMQNRNIQVNVDNTVVVRLPEIKIPDATVNIYLDSREISREELSKPIKIRTGDHELVMKRGDVVVETRKFHVGKEDNDKTIDLPVEQETHARIAQQPPAPVPVPALEKDDQPAGEPSAEIKALIVNLTDPNVGVRRQAAEALQSRGDKTAVPALMERVWDDLWDGRDAFGPADSSKLMALLALKKLGKSKVTGALVKASKSETAEVRVWACIQLAEQKDSESAAGLVACLKDASVKVRVTASASLFAFGPPAVPALVGALFDPDVGVRRQAAESLQKLGDRSNMTADAVKKVAEAAVPHLFKRVADDTWDIHDAFGPADSSKQMALLALRTLDKTQVTSALRKAAISEIAEVRVWACRELAAQIDDDSAAGLVAALKDPVPKVQVTAATSLFSFGAAAAPALVEALFDKDVFVRRQAAETLQKLGDRSTMRAEVVKKVAKDAVPALMKRVADEIWDSRDAFGLADSSKLVALAALRTLAKNQVTSALLNAIRCKNEDVRVWACVQLAEQKDKESSEALRAALKDPSPKVQTAASVALEKRK